MRIVYAICLRNTKVWTGSILYIDMCTIPTCAHSSNFSERWIPTHRYTLRMCSYEEEEEIEKKERKIE